MRGISSLRQFHDVLSGAGVEVSYEAVRNYHYDREAPVEHYLAVARIFQVNPLWLLTGEGEMEAGASAVSGGAVDARGEKLSLALSRLAFLEGVRTDFRILFGWFCLDTLNVLGLDWQEAPQGEVDDFVQALAALFLLPWQVLGGSAAWGEEDEERFDRRFRTYALAMRTALEAARTPLPEGDADRVVRTLFRMPQVGASLFSEPPDAEA